MREATRWTRWLLVTLGVVVLDLATKFWIMQTFTPGEVLRVTPFFNLVLVFNTGAAFSFLAGAGGWQRWFFMTISIVVSLGILWLLRRHATETRMASALALVLGGALGNLYDRVTIGQVIDFVQIHAAGYYWPAFNVADSAISIGVVLLIWDSLAESSAARAAKRQQS